MGIIERVISTQSSVEIHVARTDGQVPLIIRVNPGPINTYVHFTNIDGKVVRPSQTVANGIDLNLVEPEK